MRRRRRLCARAVAVIAPLTVTLAAACSSSEPGTTADGRSILRYQGQTGTVTPYELADDLGYFQHIRLHWEGDTTSGPANIQAAATRQIEFGSAFNGAVVTLAADREIQIWIDWLIRDGQLAPDKVRDADIYTNTFNPYTNGTYPPQSGPSGEVVAAT